MGRSLGTWPWYFLYLAPNVCLERYGLLVPSPTCVATTVFVVTHVCTSSTAIGYWSVQHVLRMRCIRSITLDLLRSVPTRLVTGLSACTTLAGPGLGPGRLQSPCRPPRCTLHTAFSPMINGIRCGRCRGKRRQPSDVDGVFGSSYLKADCTIIINL